MSDATPERKTTGMIPISDKHGNTVCFVRIDEIGEETRHTAIVLGGGSAHDTANNIAMARDALKKFPEPIRHMEIQVTPQAKAAMDAAKAKRARKAALRLV